MVLVRLTFGSDIQGGFKSVRLGASLNIQRLGMNMVAYWGAIRSKSHDILIIPEKYSLIMPKC